MTLTGRQRNAGGRQRPDHYDVSYLGPPTDWYLRDKLTRMPVSLARRQSLSPTRKLALDHLEAQDKPGSRKYEAVKSLAKTGDVGGTKTCRQAALYKAHSVLDIDRIRRRADKRCAEVALHLVSHDPRSSLFRAALSSTSLTYQLAPRLPSAL